MRAARCAETRSVLLSRVQELASVEALIRDVDANEHHAISRYDGKGSEAGQNNRACQINCTDCKVAIDLVSFTGRCIKCYLKFRDTGAAAAADDDDDGDADETEHSAAPAAAAAAAAAALPARTPRAQSKRKARHH